MNSGKGTTVLILGILSLIICQLLGPVAWIMGNSALQESTDPNDRNLANIGRILGIIATVLMLLGILIWVLAMVGILGLGLWGSSRG